MAKQRIENVVFDLTKPITDELNFELVDVEFKKEGQNWYLRIYVDKEGGVGLDDCELVSSKISDLLDEVDPIPDSYFLEVSSPGLERPLKKESDFVKYIDREIEVTLYQPLNDTKYFKGVNKGIKDETLNILLEDDNLIEIPMKLVALVKLYFEL